VTGSDGKEKEKPICSTFLGTSPEFEIAAYTLCFYCKQVICFAREMVTSIKLSAVLLLMEK